MSVQWFGTSNSGRVKLSDDSPVKWPDIVKDGTPAGYTTVETDDYSLITAEEFYNSILNIPAYSVPDTITKSLVEVPHISDLKSLIQQDIVKTPLMNFIKKATEDKRPMAAFFGSTLSCTDGVFVNPPIFQVAVLKKTLRLSARKNTDIGGTGYSGALQVVRGEGTQTWNTMPDASYDSGISIPKRINLDFTDGGAGTKTITSTFQYAYMEEYDCYDTGQVFYPSGQFMTLEKGNLSYPYKINNPVKIGAVNFKFKQHYLSEVYFKDGKLYFINEKGEKRYSVDASEVENG